MQTKKFLKTLLEKDRISQGLNVFDGCEFAYPNCVIWCSTASIGGNLYLTKDDSSITTVWYFEGNKVSYVRKE